MKETALLLGFSWAKIPLIGFISPRILEVSETRVEIRVPLTWRNRNHLGSMYFGVLCTAADVAGGLLAMRLIQASGKPIQLVFKDFSARFLKRPTSDVHFICEDGEKVRALVARAASGTERVEETVFIRAICPAQASNESVAEFQLTISLKQRS